MNRSATVFNVMFLCLFLGFVAQFIIDFNYTNITSACLVAISTIITLLYLRHTKAFIIYPLSSFIIFGFLFTSQFGAIVVQSLLATSLTKDLRVPIETFGYLLMFQMSALVAHVFYRMLSNPTKSKPSIIRHTLGKVGLYATPSIMVVWIMGLVGLASSILSHGDQASKVANGAQFVLWTPFLIPIYAARFGRAYCNMRTQYFFLALFALAIAAIGVAFNARGFMVIGIVTASMIIFLQTLRSDDKFTSKHFKGLFLLVLLAIAIAKPLADLATAMGVARQDRAKASLAKMIETTADAFTRKELLLKYREEQSKDSIIRAYDENYVPNPLLARLVVTKFHDNMFYFGDKLSPDQVDALFELTKNRIITILPDPILKIKMLDLHIEKSDYQFSMGDFIVKAAIGGNLGGYITGSALAQGMVMFGFFFPFMYMIICIVLFYLKDLLSYKTNNDEIMIAPLGFIGLYLSFQLGISQESLNNFVAEVVRTFPQNILIYLIIYHAARLITWVFASVSSLNPKINVLGVK